MRTEWHGLMFFDLLLFEPGIIESEVQVKILKIALTRLITNRTIEWMVRKKELQHCSPTFRSLVAVRVHNHPFRYRRIAGNLGLRHLLYLDEADAAIAGD